MVLRDSTMEKIQSHFRGPPILNSTAMYSAVLLVALRPQYQEHYSKGNALSQPNMTGGLNWMDWFEGYPAYNRPFLFSILQSLGSNQEATVKFCIRSLENQVVNSGS